jgi:hypothetical protein
MLSIPLPFRAEVGVLYADIVPIGVPFNVR